MIERVGKHRTGAYLWKCLCDCGAVILKNTSEIRRRSTKRHACTQCQIDRGAVYARQDITGVRFGKLIAIKGLGGSHRRGSLWEAKCDCGVIVEIPASRLFQLKQTGCKRCMAEARRIGRMTHGGWSSRHGTKQLARVWTAMMDRCGNPKNVIWPNYGGRGVVVCDEWKNFLVFKEWAFASGYSPYLTIDRKDVYRGYNPANCEWVTRAENTRRAAVGTAQHSRTDRLLSNRTRLPHFPIEMFGGF